MRYIAWLNTDRTDGINPATGEPLDTLRREQEEARMRSDYSDVMEQRARRVSDAMADAVVLRPMRPPQSDTEFIEAARGFLYTTRPYRVMALAPMYPTSAYGVANTWPDGSVDLSDPNPPGLINYRPSKAAYAQLRHMLTSEPIDPPTGVPVDADGRIDGARVPLPVPGLNIGDVAQVYDQTRPSPTYRLALYIGPNTTTPTAGVDLEFEPLQGRVGRVLMPVTVPGKEYMCGLTVYEVVDETFGLRRLCDQIAVKVAQTRKGARIQQMRQMHAQMGWEAPTDIQIAAEVQVLGYEIRDELYELAVCNLAYCLGIFQTPIAAVESPRVHVHTGTQTTTYHEVTGHYDAALAANAQVNLQLGMLWQGAAPDVRACIPSITVRGAWLQMVHTHAGVRSPTTPQGVAYAMALPEDYSKRTEDVRAHVRRWTIQGPMRDVFVVGTRNMWLRRSTRARRAFETCDASSPNNTAMVRGTLHPCTREIVLPAQPERAHMESDEAYNDRLRAWTEECAEAGVWHERTKALMTAAWHLPLDQDAMCCYVHFQRPLVDETGAPLPGTLDGGLARTVHCRSEVHAGTLYGVDPEQEAVSGNAVKTDLAALCECLR